MKRWFTTLPVAAAAAAAAVVVGTGTGVAAAAPSAAPMLAWSPSSGNYGTLAPGASATQTFTLTNTGGSATSALTSTVTAAAGFTITADHCTGKSLGGGKSCTVSVTFTAPTALGQASQATLTATAPGKPAVIAMVALSGASASCVVTDTTSGQTYTDLPTAVNHANPDDALTIEGSCTGTTINENLALTGLRGGSTRTGTLNGNGQGTVLTIGSNATVTLTNLFITGGNAGSSGLGGGIDNGGTLTLTNTNVLGNTAGDGGGIWNTGTLTLTAESAVTDNTGVVGGGIQNGPTGTVTLTGSFIDGNEATLGGGIYSQGTLTLTGTEVTGNTTTSDGGGIYSDAGTLTLDATSSVTSNTAGGNGGGIINLRPAPNSVTVNGTVSGNTATGDGGGIYNEGPADAVLITASGSVTGNNPDNCFPENTITGCTS